MLPMPQPFFLHHDFCLKNLLILQGLLLLFVALLPLVAESAPTIQSLVPAIAFTPVVCPIALARSIIKKVLLSLSFSLHENIIVIRAKLPKSGKLEK